MPGTVLNIKNVVCPRCIAAIEQLLNELKIPFSEVSLGQAKLERELIPLELHRLDQEFQKIGFEILQDKQQKLINNIKSVIIEKVYSEDPAINKISSLLTAELPYDYSHITHIFTESEGKSIQKFYNAVRIERAKELLNYEDWNIAMIADNLGYSTPAYLSTSFKKATGLSPSDYKKLPVKDRKGLDQV